MKKIFLTLIGALALAPAAFAGSIAFDGRVDYNATTYNDEAGVPNFTKFYLKTGRVDYQGKANEDLSFRVRWSFTADQVPTKRDSVPKGIQYAYIKQKMSDNFSLTLGKYNTEFGGFEGATSGSDLFLISEFYSGKGADGKSLSDTTLNTTDLLYMTGAKASFDFAGQQVHLMAADADTDDNDAGGNLQQNYGLMGVSWTGAFMEKALNIKASYHMMNRSDDDKYSFMAVGAQWNAALLFQLDYLVSQHELTDKDMLTSIVGKVGYTFNDQWKAFLEVTSSEEKRELTVSETNKFMGYGAVVQYMPYADAKFRYHAAYNMTTEKPDSGDDIERTEVIVGAYILADFLK